MVNGATTLYENWPIDAKSDISMNHIMFGEIGAWLYKALGGIKPDPGQPGFKHILLEPHFVKRLDHFEASHNGPYGMIRSSWKRVDKGIEYQVTIPPNSSATVKLSVDPSLRVYLDGQLQPATGGILEKNIEAGTYIFNCR
jgi:alpha-L-rhamnosidase